MKERIDKNKIKEKDIYGETKMYCLTKVNFTLKDPNWLPFIQKEIDDVLGIKTKPIKMIVSLLEEFPFNLLDEGMLAKITKSIYINGVHGFLSEMPIKEIVSTIEKATSFREIYVIFKTENKVLEKLLNKIGITISNIQLDLIEFGDCCLRIDRSKEPYCQIFVKDLPKEEKLVLVMFYRCYDIPFIWTDSSGIEISISEEVYSFYKRQIIELQTKRLAKICKRLLDISGLAEGSHVSIKIKPCEITYDIYRKDTRSIITDRGQYIFENEARIDEETTTFVLAHEVAHIKQNARQYRFFKPVMQAREYNADKLATQYLLQLGFKNIPAIAEKAFQSQSLIWSPIFHRQKGDKIINYFTRTHPSDEQRVARIRKIVDYRYRKGGFYERENR